MALKTTFAAIVAAGMLGAPGAALAQQSVKIGVPLPLSGPNAQFGISVRNGLELALADINGAGGIKSLGGAKVELVYADVPAPNAAGAATQRLISQEQVVGLVGSFVSSVTLAVSEVAERAGVPMITHSFADQITERGYKFIFQVAPKASRFGHDQFGYAVAIGKKAGTDVKKVAILYEDTAYGTAQAKGLRDAAKAAGIEIVVDEGYPLGITDVAPLINKIRATSPDIVFPVSYFHDALLILRTMRQQQIDIPAVGGAAGYIIPEFEKGLGQYADGVFSIAPANYDAAPEINARYKARHGSFPPHEALMYPAALEHLVRAIETAKSRDPEMIRDAVAKLRYCEGFARALPGGCTAFDAKGLTSVATPIFVQWRGAELETVYPDADAKAKPRWKGKAVD